MASAVLRGIAFAVLLFVLVQLGALALVDTFFEQGYQAVENPEDPSISLLFLGAILLATGFMLAAFKYDLDWIVRLVVVGVSGLLAFYVFAALIPVTIALLAGLAVAIAVFVYPEWYVIDTAGVLMGAGAAGLFGITFGVLPALLLLVVLAVYDAISVYGTEHMLDLAEGVMDLNIPVVLIVPLSLSYSLLDEEPSGAAVDPDSDEKPGDNGDEEVDDRMNEEIESADDPEEIPEGALEREAFFIGLGDAVIPAVLVASAAFFSPATNYDLPIVELNTPALLAGVGTIAGLLTLMWMVQKGRAHAGLPLLNGGAIGGYLLGSILAGIPLIEAIGLGPFL